MSTFPQSESEMKALQQVLAQKVLPEDQFKSPQFIAGMDVSHHLYDPTQTIHAAIVLLNYPELDTVEEVCVQGIQPFPYIPGLLGFREAPFLIEAFQKLRQKPDLLMVDGHGISHPRGLGIASHLGVLLNLPTIGVAKSILVGKPATSLGTTEGSTAPLVWHGKTIGLLYRSKKRANPLIISIGHQITLSSATEWVKNCLQGYRLPEPTRRAHLLANRCRQADLQTKRSGSYNMKNLIT